ncbi:MAG: hypothetical protein JSR82_24810 [Verrucomicrobia bacterium]|nr:hypothetical protein [Verrucomicrobiota bacterium]
MGRSCASGRLPIAYRLFCIVYAEPKRGCRGGGGADCVSGLYFGHPESKYFGVGKIGRDQLEDYALRENMPLPVAERWLAPSLA